MSRALVNMHSFKQVSKKSICSLMSWSTVSTLVNLSSKFLQFASNTSPVAYESNCLTKLNIRFLKLKMRIFHRSISMSPQ